MRKRLIKFIATGYGVGYVPFAPGLAGSLVGLFFWWLVAQTGQFWQPWLYGFHVIVSVVIADEAARIIGKPDPPCVVIDEIVAVPLALAGLGIVWWKVALAFVLFRLFDVWKPAPVRQAQAFSGGLGIVLDDLLAALYACGATHAVVWAVERIGHRSF